jgi:hypothetical protein
MDEQKLLGLAILFVGIVFGANLGVFLAVLPTSDPYLVPIREGHFDCSLVNNTTYSCVFVQDAVLGYDVCVNSYWFGQLCHSLPKGI